MARRPLGRLASPKVGLAMEEGIKIAIDSMRKAYARDEVRELIEAREKAERDEVSRMHYALNKGLRQGREEGRQETLKHAATEMLKRDLDRTLILGALGITAEQLD